ncbi:hypothetical protein TNCV_4336161 [Trichonephila clavipes]|nr:hypothetical protein TNCV_4336161 [Trichonephila clavipes]
MPHRNSSNLKQLSNFERDRIIGLKEAVRVIWRIIRHVGQSEAAIRRYCQIARYLSNRACLGYEGKKTESTGKC